jgi:hypothetical protein
VRLMRLRYAGRCKCGAEVPAGTRAGWSSAHKTVTCPDCLERQAMHRPENELPVLPDEISEPTLRERAQRDAGASLAAEYERRMARREERVTQRLPRIGGLLLKIFDEAPSTKAFKKGADGERTAIKKLLNDSGPNVLFLVNRRLGKGRRDGDVDVVAVSPGGVLVIDVKRYADAKVRVEREGGLFTARHDVLMVRGRDQSRLLDGLGKQIDAVTLALRTDERFRQVPVSGALCFVDADLPLFGRLEARGYSIASAKGTAKALRESTAVLPQDLVEQVADHLDAELPPALGQQA